MKNPAGLPAIFLLQKLQNPICAAPCMNQQWFLHLLCQADHLDENFFLNLPGDVNLAIQAHFADCGSFIMAQQLAQGVEMGFLQLACGLRVNTRRREDLLMQCGGCHHLRPLLRRDSRYNPGGNADLFSIFEQLGWFRKQIKMNMRVNITGHSLQIVSQPSLSEQESVNF
jgi:hypothetical protein